jgi:preprotein translocase subunit SecE
MPYYTIQKNRSTRKEKKRKGKKRTYENMMKFFSEPISENYKVVLIIWLKCS